MPTDQLAGESLRAAHPHGSFHDGITNSVSDKEAEIRRSAGAIQEYACAALGIGDDLFGVFAIGSAVFGPLETCCFCISV